MISLFFWRHILLAAFIAALAPPTASSFGYHGYYSASGPPLQQYLKRPFAFKPLLQQSTTADNVDSDASVSSSVAAELIDRGIASEDLEQAAILFQQAVDQDDGKCALAHVHLAATFQRQNNLAAAAQSFRRAIELQPADSDDSKFQLGQILTAMGYVEQAVTILRDLVARNQQEEGERPSPAKIALANVLLDGLGEKNEALSIFLQSCEFARPSPMALLAGVVADSKGSHAAAEEYYSRGFGEALNMDPDTALHLMLSRLRRNDKVGAANLRTRLPDYIGSSVDYILSTNVRLDPSMHYFTYDMIQLALTSTLSSPELKDGLILEFGVYHGKTIRMISSHFAKERVHGFDTFAGIPEQWHNTPSGSYSTHGSLPMAPDTVEYHVGLFSETLPGFLEVHTGPIKLMNIDCDLYSSTKDVLDCVCDRVVPGTVIIFDEYVMNPHWKDDEYRAFQEAVETYGWKYEYLAVSLVSQQAVVRIL